MCVSIYQNPPHHHPPTTTNTHIQTNRLWTHGFDFYAPGEAVLYHLWSRAHRPNFRHGPQKKQDRARAEGEERAARRRVRRLLGGWAWSGEG